ncbi:MAG: hypothetical protein LC637_08675 [Xanthomonadaceae bacterium]|nr:hypothetical protein [Xanthomonadaceae bacterium]
MAACDPLDDDAERIRVILAEMAQALVQGDVGDFLDPIADDFIAAERGLDKSAVRLVVMRERLARRSISVQRLNTRVEVLSETRATADFELIATGGDSWLPDEGRLWRIETGWRLDRGDWKLVTARWDRAL